MLQTISRLAVILFLVFAIPTHAFSGDGPVHNFHCNECHLSGLTINELAGDNVCLRCHHLTSPDVTMNPDAPPVLDGHTDGRFTSGDASNLFGHGNGQPTAKQTSHTWAASSDNLPRAGAVPPNRTLYPQFYSRYGTSSGKITCSRCHDPHASVGENAKLLILGDQSEDLMCRACHAPWDQVDNHGWLTHPIVADYNASVLAEPDKYKTSLDNKDNADVRLVDGGVSCSSCHGAHFVDSDSATTDSALAVLNQADGKLLRGDGSGSSDKSSLCQTCHSYLEHGDDSGEKAGCLVCHSGHSYDPSTPNYYVLRKIAETTAFGTSTNLDYSSPDLVDPGKTDSKYAFWADPANASGYCEKCHGEAASLPGSIHSENAYCTDCHKHGNSDGGSFGHPGGGDCMACHASDHVVSNAQVDWVTIFDPASAHTNDDPPYSGPIYAYATCTMCHTTNLLTQHDSNCILCHFGASPARDSFMNWDQSCQQGSCHATYHANASDLHDDYYWRASTAEPGYSCSKCHSQSGFVVPWPGYEAGYLATASDCGACHALKPDNYPPVVESDLKSDYIDSAIITLSATDPSGVNTIYYSLDGGGTQTYSGPITVTAPSSGSDLHSISYWARDNSGNTGTPTPQNFTVHHDITPPVTTSDTRDYYGADATIQLSATDDADFYPPAATYYVFNDPGGVPTEGTTAVFPEPASGTEVHTIYFWSVDHTGNVESAKSATFTMVANGLVQATMPMGANLRGYADPYWFSGWNSANPSITYTISIVDVDQDPDAVILTDTITRRFNSYYPSPNNYQPASPQTWTTNWPCPPNLPISAGDKILIEVDAEFSDQEFWPGFTDFPVTYTLTLPAGTVQLESANWKFTTTMGWLRYEYIEAGDVEVSWIDVLPKVENISYVTTSP